MKYCLYGMSLLGNLDFHYQQSSPHVRKKLLGSIFTGKLVFENGNYRATGLNEGVALIYLFQKELGNKKIERLDISDKTFGNVPNSGTFSNQFIEGMKKLYELQTFLDVRLLRPGEESSKVREELLALTGT